jgi:hypothetical protein
VGTFREIGQRENRNFFTPLGRHRGGALFAAILVSFSSPTFAQQRVVVEKATGNVVDVGDGSLQYDARYFDHMDLANSPIPAGEDVRKYTRDTAKASVLTP